MRVSRLPGLAALHHGPIPGRLIRPNGSARSRRVTLVGSDDLWQAAFLLPFLIYRLDRTHQVFSPPEPGPPTTHILPSLVAIRILSMWRLSEVSMRMERYT